MLAVSVTIVFGSAVASLGIDITSAVDSIMVGSVAMVADPSVSSVIVAIVSLVD